MSMKKIFIALLAIIGLLAVLGVSGQAWAKSMVVVVLFMPLVLLSALGVNGLFHEQPDVIFAEPTLTGIALMAVVDLLLLYFIALALHKFFKTVKPQP